jgi:hypothetical protein
MASAMVCIVGSPIATITTTSRKVGVVWNSSTTRISRVSTQPPKKPAAAPYHHADGKPDGGSRQADQQRRPRAMDQAREHIAAERIGSERKLGALARPQDGRPTMSSGSPGTAHRRTAPSGRRRRG